MFNKLEGTLMSMQESPDTRFRYTIWFDYTREAINEIQEGTMLAVANFGSDTKFRRWSILEITSVMPSHFALQSGNSGYPGFVIEAARSAAQDWESQDKEATEETTKIEATAIPTLLEIVEPELETVEPESYGDDISFDIGPETNMAMVGSKVRVLDSETTNRIANNGIDQENEKNLATIGTLARDSDVEILMRIDGLLRTHFAIFGFTGVGKSNLLSTIVAKIFTSTQEPIKLVFFDLMSEYTSLLVDQLLSDEIDGRLLTIGRDTLPEGVFKYINKLRAAPKNTEATKQLLQYTLLPKALQRRRNKMGWAFLDFIKNDKVRYFDDSKNITVWDLFFTSEIVDWGKERRSAKSARRDQIVTKALRKSMDTNSDYREILLDPELAKQIKENLEELLQEDDYKEFKEDGDFTNHIFKLGELQKSTAEELAASTALPEIIADLNDNTRHSLWVVQAHDPDELRKFSHDLGNELYESRRRKGTIDPVVGFIFDEADEFIRASWARSGGTGSYEQSARIAETIARRGRKFGIGLGIATQRIRYLDTNIMSQPHTYFISKLPRATDRTAVSEAFGFGDEMLNQTFKFEKGQWLLVSHDATGLEAVPLPVKTEDANERVASFLDSKYTK